MIQRVYLFHFEVSLCNWRMQLDIKPISEIETFKGSFFSIAVQEDGSLWGFLRAGSDLFSDDFEGRIADLTAVAGKVAECYAIGGQYNVTFTGRKLNKEDNEWVINDLLYQIESQQPEPEVYNGP